MGHSGRGAERRRGVSTLNAPAAEACGRLQAQRSVWQGRWRWRGHPGSTLSQTDRPDRIRTHLPESCADCGEELTADDIEGNPSVGRSSMCPRQLRGR